MGADRSLARIALYGSPGAGKSTSAQMIEEVCKETGAWFSRIKLAEPLYEAQSVIYQLAGVELAHRYQQDGELLSFLGQYMRRLNPTTLLDSFATRYERACHAFASGTVRNGFLVCDDMRSLDSGFVRALGFTLVRVTASPELCSQRRALRGDLTAAELDHPLGGGLDEISADLILENEASLDALATQVRRMIAIMRAGPER